MPLTTQSVPPTLRPTKPSPTDGVEVELGPVRRSGARGEGTSVYFRDPDGSLLELISYA
jgi:catechol 2,3-dioxygenase-like lactoylglutathione lyase family enzyme